MRWFGKHSRVLGASASAVLSLAACTRLVDFDRFAFETDAGVIDAAVIDDSYDLSAIDAPLPAADLSRGDMAGDDLAGGVLIASNGVSCPQMGSPVVLVGNAIIDTETAKIEGTDGSLILAGTVQQNDIAVFCASSIIIPDGSVVTAKGKFRIAFVVEESFYLNGAIDLYGLQGSSGGGGGASVAGGAGGGDRQKVGGSVALGAGGGGAGETPSVPVMSPNLSRIGGGGGGGGSRLAGALGGMASLPAALGGTATPGDAAGVLRFGGGGGGGGGGTADKQNDKGRGGGGGGGGGAVQITALGGAGLILFGDLARLDVTGGGGGGGKIDFVTDPSMAPLTLVGGGGGGGAGGTIWLEAATVTLPAAVSACITAVGGGGGNGATSSTAAKDGDAAVRRTTCTFAGIAPNSTNLTIVARGGAGSVPTAGQKGFSNITTVAGGGGGGGGSPGYIRIRSRNVIEASRIFSAPSTELIP